MSSGQDALNGVAAVAQAALNTQPQPEVVEIVYRNNATDRLFLWRNKTPFVPCLWPPYEEAVSFLCAFEPSAALRMVRATESMTRYYEFNHLPLPVTGLSTENIRARMTQAKDKMDMISASLREAAGQGRHSYTDFCQSAGFVVEAMRTVVEYLVLSDNTDNDISGILKKCYYLLKRIEHENKRFSEKNTRAFLQSTIKDFINDTQQLYLILQEIVHGIAIVRNNQTLPGFFLMRLMVIFRISPREFGNRSYAGIASGQLTKFLHEQGWVKKVMPRMVTDLAREIQKFGDKVCFFLKGGRGLQYLLNRPESGENDWDTQIIIDPRLPQQEWWSIYEKTCGIVYDCLTRYNFVFTAYFLDNAEHLYQDTQDKISQINDDCATADRVYKEICDVTDQVSKDEYDFSIDPEILAERNLQQAHRGISGNCNAELIDVGLPRYYTVELLEQWDHVRPSVVNRNIPYPGVGYFVDEFILMLREKTAGVSSSPAKSDKRLDRLLSVMSSGDYQTFLAQQKGVIPEHQFVDLKSAIDELYFPDASGLASIMLSQFYTAYDLDLDIYFAKVIEQLASAFLPVSNIRKASDSKQAVDYVFAWSHELSEAITDHLKDRTLEMLDIVNPIIDVLTSIVNKYQVRVDIVFEENFSILLHNRDYLCRKNASPLKNSSGPAPFAFISLYLRDRDEIDDTLFDLVCGYVMDGFRGCAIFGEVRNNFRQREITIFTKKRHMLDGLPYTPLAVVLRMRPGTEHPRDVSNSRLPLLGLRSLEIWCRARAASINEWKRRLQLIENCGALVEMLAYSIDQAAPPTED